MDELISPRQVKAVESLLGGSTVPEAAGVAGVHVRTLRRWLETPGFTQALKDGENRILEAVGVRLSGMSVKALDVLESILESDGLVPGDGVRRLAAVNTLDLLHEWKELRDFEDRLKRLEDEYASQNTNRKTGRHRYS